MRKSRYIYRIYMAFMLLVGYYALAFVTAIGLLVIPIIGVYYAQMISFILSLFCFGGFFAIVWSFLPNFSKFIKPGPELSAMESPKLFKVLQDIADATGQEVPNHIYLTFELNAWVSERSSFLGLRKKKIMGIGYPLLRLLNESEMRGIIAHEFAHYSSADTKLAPIVYKTRMKIERTIDRLNRLNPYIAGVFIEYNKFFLRITSRISREQEHEADRMSAAIAGTNHIRSALQKVYSSHGLLENFVEQEIQPIIESGYYPDIDRLFDLYLQAETVKTQMRERLQIEVNRSYQGIYDSHPILKQRLQVIDELSLNNTTQHDIPIHWLDSKQVLEQQLNSYLWGNKQSFKTIDMTILETACLEMWQSNIHKFSSALQDITPLNLPLGRFAIYALAAKLSDILEVELYDKQAENLSSRIIGQALSIALVAKGWQLRVQPGEKTVLSMEGYQITPFHILLDLQYYRIELEDWNRLCEETHISDLSFVMGA